MTLGKLDPRPRMLIVEDIQTTRETYLASFDLEERYMIDAVESLSQALAALGTRSYHVALVDIMLAGEADIANRDGVKVVQYIHQLDEGTRVVVLSAQKETQLVRELLKDLDAFDYLDKHAVSDAGFSLISSTVRRATEASSADTTPSWSTTAEALGGSESELVAKAMKFLDFSGGFENLSRMLMSGLKHLVPLLPRRADETGLCFDDEMREFRGNFWSKGQGCPIDLRLSGRSSPNSSVEQADDPNGAPLLLDREKGGLHLQVKQAVTMKRNEFIE